jgi:Gpi18-like mannosyltransferase
MAFVFSILPARWLIVRSVGSGEPLFIAATIASIYFFQKKKFLQAGVWGALAQLTKSPGILLFVAYFCFLFFPKLKRAAISTKNFLTLSHIKKYWGLLLIPFSLVLIFILFYFRTGDFFAYFHSGDNIHLFFPPFQIFNYSQPWVGSFWLEEIIFIYLLAGMGILKLISKRQYLLAWYAGIFFLSLIFVSHRDLLRYSLPILPFVMVGYLDSLVSKEFRTVMLFLLIPIFLYSIVFISQNTLPISNWAPYL